MEKRSDHDEFKFVLNKVQYLQLNADVKEENFWNLPPKYYMRPYEGCGAKNSTMIE